MYELCQTWWGSLEGAALLWFFQLRTTIIIILFVLIHGPVSRVSLLQWIFHLRQRRRLRSGLGAGGQRLGGVLESSWHCRKGRLGEGLVNFFIVRCRLSRWLLWVPAFLTAADCKVTTLFHLRHARD